MGELPLHGTMVFSSKIRAKNGDLRFDYTCTLADAGSPDISR